MKRMAFVSGSAPTKAQTALAAGLGFKLVYVGDRDGFALDPSEFRGYDAVAVGHADAVARLLMAGVPVAVFRDGNGAPSGAPPNLAG